MESGVKETMREIKIFARTDNTDIFIVKNNYRDTLDFVNPALSGEPLRFALLLFLRFVTTRPVASSNETSPSASCGEA